MQKGNSKSWPVGAGTTAHSLLSMFHLLALLTATARLMSSSSALLLLQQEQSSNQHTPTVTDDDHHSHPHPRGHTFRRRCIAVTLGPRWGQVLSSIPGGESIRPLVGPRAAFADPYGGRP
ncbi:unnamed protein product [Amoebophrya sp. A25]|nr:unnamed protein product [Amoebophrya sp. A25]|eukprot:GSA25T00012772001.1